MKQKYIIAMILGFVLFMSVSAGSVYAWTSVDTGNTAELDTQNRGDLSLYADDGDVVTTDKWNQTINDLKYIFSLVFDWPRTKTPFFATVANTIDGKTGVYVRGISLGYNGTTPLADNGHVAFINFLDSSVDWMTGNGQWYKGSILYRPEKESLDLSGFDWGVTVDDPMTGRHLLGWEKIDIYGTDEFDISCQYRIKTTYLHFLYPAVEAGRLSLMEDSNWADGLSWPIHMLVSKDLKTNLQQIYPNGQLDFPHGTLQAIEKLCLPSYNPNGY